MCVYIHKTLIIYEFVRTDLIGSHKSTLLPNEQYVDNGHKACKCHYKVGLPFIICDLPELVCNILCNFIIFLQ